jgi:hypothetical protein
MISVLLRILCLLREMSAEAGEELSASASMGVELEYPLEEADDTKLASLSLSVPSSSPMVLRVDPGTAGPSVAVCVTVAAAAAVAAKSWL